MNDEHKTYKYWWMRSTYESIVAYISFHFIYLQTT